MSTMHDLFGVVDDPVTEAQKLLAQHGFVAVHAELLQKCLTTLHVLACDAESADEEQEINGRSCLSSEGAKILRQTLRLHAT